MMQRIEGIEPQYSEKMAEIQLHDAVTVALLIAQRIPKIQKIVKKQGTALP